MGTPEKARRGPAEVLEEHRTLGTGGTCFSLTAAFLEIVRALGFDAEPILADRHYGADTHCALLVWLDGEPHLLDPGYLLVRPIPLGSVTRSSRRDAAETRIATSFNDVVLVPRDRGDAVELHTESHGNRSHRLTFKASPADPGQFLRAWDASFAWDMMRYPVLTHVSAGEHVYLQDNRLQRRSREAVERAELGETELGEFIQREFGVDAGVVSRALDVLRRQGER